MVVPNPPVTEEVSSTVPPAQMVTSPPLTDGLGSDTTVMEAVGNELQLLEVCVNLKVEVPAVKAVITPPFVMVATAGLLDTQVPPVEEDTVVVPPIHKELSPVILTTGFTSTVALPVGFDAQPVAVAV